MTLRKIYDLKGLSTNDTAIRGTIKNSSDFEIDTAEIEVLNNFTAIQGDSIEYYDQNLVLQFAGKLRKVKQGRGTKILLVRSYEVILKDKVVEKTYINTTPEGLIASVIADFSDLTFVSNIGSTGITITEYTSKNKTAWEVIKSILQRIPAVTYTVSTSKVFTLFFLGQFTTSTSITNGTKALIAEEWKQDTDNQTTRLLLVGDKRVTPKSEVFNGDGSTVDFVLAEIPVTMEVSVSGVKKVLQLNTTNTGDYTLSKETKTITFLTAPATGTNNISATYNFELNLKVEQDADPAIITKYGIIENKITRKFLKSEQELTDYATEYLRVNGTPRNSNTVEVYNTQDINNFTAGYQIHVTDNEYTIDGASVNDFFIIQQITRTLPGQGISLQVGDKTLQVVDFFREIKDNISQLKEEDDNASITLKAQNLVNDVNIDFTVTLSEATRRTYDADSWYWQETGGTRNNWVEAGTGDVFRENSGFSDEPLFTSYIIKEDGFKILKEDGFGILLE